MTTAEVGGFSAERRHIFGIAYRMLGSVSEAEDMVQEAWLRWHAAERSVVRSPRAFLTTVVTRLCIDHLRHARRRREDYVGPWLPEPLITDPNHSANAVDLADSLSMAFLVLLERLSPAERAVFLLREVFEYDYAEIAEVVGRSETACRQVLSRAKRRVAAERPRFEASRDDRERLAAKFFAACRAGSRKKLMSLFAEDATLWSDGGGRVTAARNPIYGPDRIARFLLGVLSHAPEGLSVAPNDVNERPGLIVFSGDTPLGAISLDIAGDRIRGVYIVVNPDKIGHLRESADKGVPLPATRTQRN